MAVARNKARPEGDEQDTFSVYLADLEQLLVRKRAAARVRMLTGRWRAAGGAGGGHVPLHSRANTIGGAVPIGRSRAGTEMSIGGATAEAGGAGTSTAAEPAVMGVASMPPSGSSMAAATAAAAAAASGASPVSGSNPGSSAKGRDRRQDTPAVRSWRPSGIMVGHLHEHSGAVTELCVAPDSKFFASASDDGTVRLWDCQRLEGRSAANRARLSYTKLEGHVRALTFVGSSADTLAAGSDAGSIHVMQVEHGGAGVNTLLQPNVDPAVDGGVVSLVNLEHTFSYSSLLIGACSRGRVRSWDMRAARPAWDFDCLPGHGLVQSMIADPSGSWLLLGTTRGLYSLYDIRFMQPVATWMEPRRTTISRLAAYPSPDVSRQPLVSERGRGLAKWGEGGGGSQSAGAGLMLNRLFFLPLSHHALVRSWLPPGSRKWSCGMYETPILEWSSRRCPTRQPRQSARWLKLAM
jgi:hypothetical protein